MKLSQVEFSDQIITVTGWVDECRHQKHISFIVLRDCANESLKLPVIVNRQLISNIKLEQYLQITGRTQPLPKGKTGYRDYELHATDVKIIGDSDSDFSNRCPENAGVDCQLSTRHIYLRSTKARLTTLLHGILLKSIREHFEETECVEITPPMFVANQCEGGATLFSLQYPDSDKDNITAYLTQSSQFYLEYSLPAVGDCYCIAPSFRAERSHTRRHLTEFEHAESEWHGIFTLDQHLDKLRKLLRDVVTKFLNYGRQYLEQLGLVDHVENLSAMVNDIQIMTHKEAIEYCRTHNIYKDASTLTHFDDSDDIPEMQERAMIDKINKIVFLTKFPKEIKSFYFATNDDGTVQGCDVEVPGVGEIIGSGIREWDYDTLLRKITDAGLNIKDYTEYIDLRLYGAGRTSGMGLGVGRLLTWLLNRRSIQEVVDYPRVPGRITP